MKSPLFEGPVTQWSEAQIVLAAWLNFYGDYVPTLQSSEPDLTNEIINDDEQFDVWYQAYKDRRERERTHQETLADKVETGTRGAERLSEGNIDAAQNRGMITIVKG